LLLDTGGELKTLSSAGPPVGMMPEMEYPVSQVQLDPGSRLIFYSDGLTEAMNVAEEMYGEERLYELLKSCPSCDVERLQQTVLDDVGTFTGGAPQSDDLTLLLVQRKMTDA
jgi:sigma-B regulation protein RsbU (phosphoserine phosphatase)